MSEPLGQYWFKDGLWFKFMDGEWKKVAETTNTVQTELPNPPEEAVDHPKHYNDHPSGIEAITVCEHYNFNVGNAIKYLWRAGLKGDAVEDMKKARWYIDREIERLAKCK